MRRRFTYKRRFDGGRGTRFHSAKARDRHVGRLQAQLSANGFEPEWYDFVPVELPERRVPEWARAAVLFLLSIWLFLAINADGWHGYQLPALVSLVVALPWAARFHGRQGAGKLRA
jgi:hypothetical protein